MAEIRDQTSEEHEYLEKLHYEQLPHFTENAINTVAEEQYGATKNWRNYAERMKNILVCLLWGEENSRCKQICDGCTCNSRGGLKDARAKKNTFPKPKPQGTVQIIVEETTEQKEHTER